MSEKLQDIMLIEKLIGHKNEPIQYNMPFILLLLFVLYTFWYQQQELRKDLYSRSVTELPPKQINRTIYYKPPTQKNNNFNNLIPY